MSARAVVLPLLLPEPPSSSESWPILTTSSLPGRTWASAGMPLHMNEYEGVPEYPMMIDDEYITSRGAFDQPPDSVSFLVGFVQLSKIFKIFAECLLRHRRFTSAKKVTLSDRQDAADWINDAADEVNNIMNDLPSVLKDSDQSSTHLHVSQEAAPVFSMQTANLFVTSASVNFAFVSVEWD